MKKLAIVALLACSLVTNVVGCSTDTNHNDTPGQNNNNDPNNNDPNKQKKELTDEQKTKIAQQAVKFSKNYAKLAFASYEDSHKAAVRLKTAIVAFIGAAEANDADVDEKLNAAREAWKAAREPYLQTEVFRFAEGPINFLVKRDAAENWVKSEEDNSPELEPLINAWPLDEAVIDYVGVTQSDGSVREELSNESVIGSTEPLTKDFILGQNESEINGHTDTEKNVTVGYHAIEFMLWGQDTSYSSAGQRSSQDFQDDAADGKGERRRKYLTLITEILVEHLKFLKDQWDPAGSGSGNYYSEFIQEKNAVKNVEHVTDALRLLVGFETGGERIAQALDSHGREEEHSCFSDNTHRDMIQDIQGMLNVFNGTYKKVNQKTVGDENLGLKSLFDIADKELSDKIGKGLKTSFDAAVEAEATGRVFENMILDKDGPDGDKAVEGDYELIFKIYEDLQNTEADIVKMAEFMKIKITCEAGEDSDSSDFTDYQTKLGKTDKAFCKGKS